VCHFSKEILAYFLVAHAHLVNYAALADSRGQVVVTFYQVMTTVKRVFWSQHDALAARVTI